MDLRPNSINTSFVEWNAQQAVDTISTKSGPKQVTQ